MKITDITITEPLYYDLPLQGDARNRILPGSRESTFLRVETDEGVTGIAQTSLSSEIRALILDVFKPMVVGEDPFEVERIWEKVYWTYYGSVRRGAPHYRRRQRACGGFSIRR